MAGGIYIDQIPSPNKNPINNICDTTFSFPINNDWHPGLAYANGYFYLSSFSDSKIYKYLDSSHKFQLIWKIEKKNIVQPSIPRMSQILLEKA
jgi:hypothetical protein